MTDFLLIRHGQSANNAQPEHLRVADPGLTDLGVIQATRTADWLATTPITHLYCSPFLRALETVRPIAEARKMTVQVRADIFEQGGCYSGWEAVGKRGAAGMGRSELIARYPTWQVDTSISDAGWWGRDYETLGQAQDRALAVSQRMARDLALQGGLHAMIIHADFKYLLLQALLAKESGATFELPEPLYNAGISRVEFQKGRWKLTHLNSVEHLERSHVSF